jgi:hypothetical protein
MRGTLFFVSPLVAGMGGDCVTRGRGDGCGTEAGSSTETGSTLFFNRGIFVDVVSREELLDVRFRARGLVPVLAIFASWVWISFLRTFFVAFNPLAVALGGETGVRGIVFLKKK